LLFFFFSSRRRHTRSKRDWSSDVCSFPKKSLRKLNIYSNFLLVWNLTFHVLMSWCFGGITPNKPLPTSLLPAANTFHFPNKKFSRHKKYLHISKSSVRCFSRFLSTFWTLSCTTSINCPTRSNLESLKNFSLSLLNPFSNPGKFALAARYKVTVLSCNFSDTFIFSFKLSFSRFNLLTSFLFS